MRFAIGTAVAVATASCSLVGCTSSAAHHVADAQVRGARTPQAAAIGFDRLLSARKPTERYECPSVTGSEDALPPPGLSGRRVASVIKQGPDWIVGVQIKSSPGWAARYRVRREHGRYCVAEQIHEP